MPSGIVIHVESGGDKYSELLTQERIRVGASEDCDLRLRRSTLPAGADCLIELTRLNGHYHIAEFDPTYRLTHNGAPMTAGVEIKDGDEVRVADNGLSLRLFPVRDLPARTRPETYVAPFIESAALESAATPRRDDAKVFLREFTRELLREMKVRTKIAILLITVAFVGGILYLGTAVNRELKRSRDLMDALHQQSKQQQDVLKQQQVRQQEIDRTNQGIINTLSLAPQIRSAYGSGVGLLTGSYILVERGTGRQLRYPEPQQQAPDATAAAASEEQQPVLTPEGYGEPFEKEFAGTAFHVGDGFVITNRHLAVEPWKADPSAQVIGASVNAQFRLTRLAVYFPGIPQPFPLRVKSTSARDDLAVCLIEGRELPKTFPSLPLDKDSDAAGVGRTVVMMGYPTSEERILATLPEAESISIQQRYGSSLSQLLNHLAERNFIRPLTTQGHITDLEAQRIVYEASSAEGASGAPLFGQSGRVIGVNFGMFVQMQNVNFAAPIKFALPLLQQSGWKRDDAGTDANANTNAGAGAPKDSRSSAATNQSR